MNYGDNSFIIKLLINKRLTEENNIFTYFSSRFNSWCICSCLIDPLFNEIWSYRIRKTLDNEIVGSFIYFNLTTAEYENVYGYFRPTIADLKKFNAVFNRKNNFKIKAITAETIKKEHIIAVRHKRKMIDIGALTL